MFKYSRKDPVLRTKIKAKEQPVGENCGSCTEKFEKGEKMKHCVYCGYAACKSCIGKT